MESRYSDAIEEAKAVDVRIKKGVDLEKIKITQPFLGVPFTTKESNRVKGIQKNSYMEIFKIFSLKFFLKKKTKRS